MIKWMDCFWKQWIEIFFQLYVNIILLHCCIVSKDDTDR